MTITNLLPIEVACVDIIKVEKIHSALGNTRKCAHFRTYVRLRFEVSKKKKNSPSSNSSDDDFIASKNGSKQNEHTSPNLKSNPGAKRKARDWEVFNSETKHQFEEFGEVFVLGKYLAEA